jgi:hypothetical protein
MLLGYFLKMHCGSIRVAAFGTGLHYVFNLPVKDFPFGAFLLASLRGAERCLFKVMFFYNSGGTNKCTGPACDAVFGCLMKRAVNDSVFALAGKLDCASLYHFIACSNAEPA